MCIFCKSRQHLNVPLYLRPVSQSHQTPYSPSTHSPPSHDIHLALLTRHEAPPHSRQHLLRGLSAAQVHQHAFRRCGQDCISTVDLPQCPDGWHAQRRKLLCIAITFLQLTESTFHTGRHLRYRSHRHGSSNGHTCRVRNLCLSLPRRLGTLSGPSQQGRVHGRGRVEK